LAADDVWLARVHQLLGFGPEPRDETTPVKVAAVTPWVGGDGTSVRSRNRTVGPPEASGVDAVGAGPVVVVTVMVTGAGGGSEVGVAGAAKEVEGVAAATALQRAV
jgi:hypothetical protein